MQRAVWWNVSPVAYSTLFCYGSYFFGWRYAEASHLKGAEIMYEIGSLLIYDTTGVCRVEDIGVPEGLPVSDKSKKYYRLTPVFGSGSIYIPVDTKVFMRPVITREEAEDLIRLIKTVYVKRRNMERNGKKAGKTDQQYMKKAKALLHEELAIALGIPVDQVETYIAEMIEEK